MRRKLQVFVSSTFTDLRQERQAAVEAVLKAGHIPAGMELFTAGDQSQMKTIERWIDESDVYMLILGGRYGSVEPTSGRSYTELEFDYAAAQGKRMFSVVINDGALEDKVKKSGSAVIESEHPLLLRAFRSKVLSKMSSFFDDSKDIKLCVHESLSDIVADGGLVGWVSGAEVAETKGLQEEINRLREENAKLKTSVATDSKGVIQSADKKISDIISLLAEIKIAVPHDVSEGGDQQALVEIFYFNRNAFINGVSSRNTASSTEKWFYSSVAPRLQIHGLMLNEKTPGNAYRRSYASKLGIEVLAEIDRRMVRTAPAQSTPAADTPS